MTEIYLHFVFAHYGLYGNAPVSPHALALSVPRYCVVYLHTSWHELTMRFACRTLHHSGVVVQGLVVLQSLRDHSVGHAEMLEENVQKEAIARCGRKSKRHARGANTASTRSAHSAPRHRALTLLIETSLHASNR